MPAGNKFHVFLYYCLGQGNKRSARRKPRGLRRNFKAPGSYKAGVRRDEGVGLEVVSGLTNGPDKNVRNIAQTVAFADIAACGGIQVPCLDEHAADNNRKIPDIYAASHEIA